MPELPEVEITARRLDAALRGATIVSALAPGLNALKTFDPPLSTLEGRTIDAIRRRGKHLVVDVEGDLALLIHLMSAGRFQLYDKHAGLRDLTRLTWHDSAKALEQVYQDTMSSFRLAHA